MLGHTSIRTTQIYAKIVQQKLSNDMKALRERMNNPARAGLLRQKQQVNYFLFLI